MTCRRDVGSTLGSARRTHPQRGVALVITLILLSVITFTAITFVILARREKGAVATTTDQTISKLAAETGLERVQAEMLAHMMATTNKFDYDFKVSTNFYNVLGFNPTLAAPPNGNPLTNINYDYTIAGIPLTPAQREEVIANLYHDPRVPVTVYTNRQQTGNADFRFYLDLNQSGRHDPNGLQPVVDNDGYYVDEDGNQTGTPYPSIPPVNTLSNDVVGDLEWIGILERPDEPHSASNRFVSRYGYLVVPSGKTLDVNRAHNQARCDQGNYLDYRRNMGVGTWEMNLAAFLVDLNTNIWPGVTVPWGNPYKYDPLPTVGLGNLSGWAFEDANSLLTNRYQRDFLTQRSVRTLLPNGIAAFTSDSIDGFGSGGSQPVPVFLTNLWPTGPDPDIGRTDPVGWPGDDSTNAFFTPSEFLDPTKVGTAFADRLKLLSLAPGSSPDSTYNRYTFYRMISQLGTDGGMERGNKININYDNRVQVNAAGVANVTNYYNWDPLQFFGQAANELLREYETGHYRRILGNDFVNNEDSNFATAIPVMTNGVFIYTPSVHRLLQLAANVYDATTNQYPVYPHMPSVFRPIFADETQLAQRLPGPLPPDSLFIVDWQSITNDWSSQVGRDPKDPFVPSQRRNVGVDDTFYGVPWVVGAKKGLPNFNELTVENVFELSRKLEIGKRSVNDSPSYTNQMFLISISSSLGVEAWNSYLTAYPRTVDIYATNELDVYVSVTNLPSGLGTLIPLRTTVSRSYGVPTWAGTGSQTDLAQQSFTAVISTNLSIITNSIFRRNGQLELLPSRLSYLDADRNFFPIPDVRLSYTNKLRFIMVDRETSRIIDYVQLRSGGETNLTAELDRMSDSDRLGRNGEQAGAGGFRDIWDNTRVGGNSIQNPTRGVLVQISQSMNPFNGNSGIWKDAGGFGAFRRGSVRDEINGFIKFMDGSDRTNLVVEVPYTPTARYRLKQRWEANDPLVHYTDGDLAVNERDVVEWLPMSTNDIQSLKTIGKLNQRYQPWGGNPNSGNTRDPFRYSSTVKDPGVKSSDNWTFPTNKFPNAGWLGRVHRGTPWQTIYLKSSSIGQNRGARRAWREWTGNWNRQDALLTQPETDRRLFDVFTAALSDNATAGQMSVNQEGLAAWSAVLSGVMTLSNSTPDDVLAGNPFLSPTNGVVIIEPAGFEGTNSPLGSIWYGINRTRADTNEFPSGFFESTGDVLATPELTDQSPFLNQSDMQRQSGITDAMYERIPQQILGLLRGNEQPRFVVYAYGQSLKPADRSLVLSGPNVGLCTNYQITAEAAIRAVVQVRGAPDNPRVIVESFSYLPPE